MNKPCLSISLATAAALTACANTSTPPSIAVRDSAGVRIVTNLRGSLESAKGWSLSPEPIVEIGAGASPEVPLFRVTAVVPLNGGRVAVGMDTPPQALLFDADGTLAATLGRRGEGPGEFMSVGSVVPLGGDSLAVWDPGRRRMSVFTAGGRFAREVNLSDLAPLTPLAAPNSAATSGWTYLLPTASGSLVLLGLGSFFGPGEGVRRVEVPSYRLTPDGEELTELGPFPGEQSFMSPQTGPLPYPFGARTYGATSGDALVIGTGEEPELRFYDATGALERILRWPDRERAFGGPFVTAWSEVVDDWLATRAEGERALYRDMLDRMPPPERFPAYDGLITAETGEVWVAEYAGQPSLRGTPIEVRTPARRWLVFDAGGALVATVKTPDGFQPHAVRAGRVWGVFEDELDVESVRAYAVLK